MNTPTYDEFASTGGYLRWFQSCLPYPVRVNGIHTDISMDMLADAMPAPEFHCRLFNLSSPEDIKAYTVIYQRILDGWYELLNIQRYWDDKEKRMMVWMEWSQNYLEVSSDESN